MEFFSFGNAFLKIILLLFFLKVFTPKYVLGLLSEVSIIEPGQPKDQHNQACFNLGRPVS